MDWGRLAVFASTFVLAMAIVGAIPAIVAFYRERVQIRLFQTGRELDRFFINIKPGRVILIVGVLGILIGWMTGSWVAAGAIALGGLFAPKLILAIWKDIRSGQVENQLMDALMLMGNTLRSGLDIAAAVERVALTLKPPISEEFGLVLNAYRLGAPLETALLDLTRRIRSRTLETVIYAINIQRETGGNLIKSFDQLILTMRDESKLQKKVRAITSQGRTQIIFMAFFPWALALLFFFLAPDFMRPALANPWGQMVMVFLVVWEIIGIFVTKKIVAVDV